MKKDNSMTEEQINYKGQSEAWLKEQSLVIKNNIIELNFLKKQTEINNKRMELLIQQLVFAKKLKASFKASLKKYLMYK